MLTEVEIKKLIDDDALSEVQKLHDLEMSSSYFEELKALINSL